MKTTNFPSTVKPLVLTVWMALTLPTAFAAELPPALPAAPSGVGYVERAPLADAVSVPAYVDFAYTNQRGDARYSTLATNAGVRVVSGFLDIWTPSTLIVDAGVSAAAAAGFPAVVPSTWSGIPGSASDGTVKNAAVHAANVQYVIDATNARTAAQTSAAYFDDRRQKGYSVTDGLGPLTGAWRSAAKQTTTIVDIPADATTTLYNDGGTNTGVGGSANATFGAVVDFVNNMSGNASTEPAKRFYKYARPWRWSSNVYLVPALVPARSTTPMTDSGYISGHAAEATRDALAMAYLLPERFQEMLLRGLELGENRIFAGMHSPLDVIGGRIQAQAVVTASLFATPAATRKAAFDQAHGVLMSSAKVTTQRALFDYAHSAATNDDRFAEHDTNKANYLRRLSYGFAPIADSGAAAVVPKGAEQLLETRLPYLDAEQRRVVLKTTALASGYPLMDDAEGWGRLNLFDAADGYGAFNGDVTVTMDAGLGGFNAEDSWRNDIAGAGALTKNGSGTLRLTGNNSYRGGSVVNGGKLIAASASAFGSGDVYNRGTVATSAAAPLHLDGNYTQLDGATLELNVASAQDQLQLDGTATVAGGALVVNLGSDFRPAARFHLIGAEALHGRFSTVSISGGATASSYTISYTDKGVDLGKRGDFTGEGVIDMSDVKLLNGHLNQSATAANEIFDLNHDGVINAVDARLLVTLCSKARCQ